MEKLEKEIKELIVSSLQLENVKAENIDSEAPLFVEGLGLDSIDALELAMAIRKRFGVKTQVDDAQNKKIFASVRALATYVSEQQAAQAKS